MSCDLLFVFVVVFYFLFYDGIKDILDLSQEELMDARVWLCTVTVQRI